MKTPKLLSILSTTAALVTYSQAEVVPSIPIGKLFITSTVVEPFVKPNLSWEITHPINITDVVDIVEATDSVTTTTKVNVKVSMIGSGITDSSGNQYDSISEIKFGSGPWEHIFTGPGRAVDRTHILVEKEIESGVSIEFRSRYKGNAQWRYNTSSEVQVLVSGQKPPANPSSDSLATSAEEYMQPYTKDGRLLLGALDLIYAAELTHTKTSDAGYDMQDSIVLVRFSDIETQIGSAKGEIEENVNGGKSNNGHGNNIDGIDVSNPGQGAGGPNGELDTDYDNDGAFEDDESKSSNREYSDQDSTVHDYSDYDTSKGCGYAGGGLGKDLSKKKNQAHDDAKKMGKTSH